MNKMFYLILLACVCSFTSCIKQLDLYSPEVEPEETYFDFSTIHSVTIDVDYGKLCGRTLLQLFTTNPITLNDDGSFTIADNSVFSIFTDDNGCYVGDVNIPSAAENVYLVANSFVAPMCVEVIVENDKILYSYSNNTAVDTRLSSSSASRLTLNTVDDSKKLYSIIGTTSKYGHLDDFNGLKSEGSVSNDVVSKLQYMLWKGSAVKSNKLDNTAYLRDTKYVNTVIADAYEKADGTVALVENADVYFTFITEAGWNQNVLGYYYYKTGECPSSPDGLKKYVMLPNASIAGNVPYVDTAQGKAKAYGYKNAPISPNTRIQLLYEDADGNLSTSFPAGYTIGYFVIQNGFTEDGKINANGTIFYSNSEWNTKFNGYSSRFISMTTTDGTVVYGTEDGEDKSYEDILFCIDANPNEAIQNPDRPVIDPDRAEITTVESSFMTYAFEDVWPHGGDYDMNDVIVEHSRSIKFNQYNYVSEVKDVFKAVQKSGAAIYKNAFAVQFEPSQRGTMTATDGVVAEDVTNSMILFKNCIEETGVEHTVTRKFAASSMNKSNLKVSVADINPYIIVHFNGAGRGNRTEVHMPKMAATTLANKSLIGSDQDAYYIDKGGNYPFAISIPARFTPVTESVSISEEYPKFDSWVKSNGTTDADWYLNYKK